MTDLRRELIEALACGPDAPHCDTCNAVEIVAFILGHPAMVAEQDVIAAAQDWAAHVVVPRDAPVSRSRRLVEAVRAYNGTRA